MFSPFGPQYDPDYDPDTVVFLDKNYISISLQELVALLREYHKKYQKKDIGWDTDKLPVQKETPVSLARRIAFVVWLLVFMVSIVMITAAFFAALIGEGLIEWVVIPILSILIYIVFSMIKVWRYKEKK